MSIKFINAVWEANHIGEQSTLLVMLALADFSNDEGWSWPSIPTLAKKARISDRHVRRILKALEEGKVLEVDHRNGRNHTNRYKLTLPICPVLFTITDAETLTSATEKRTPESVDADIACPTNRQEPPQTEPEPCATREVEFIDALDRYWKHKNPEVKFAFTPKDRRNLRVMMADYSENILPMELFRKCLNNRARDPAVKVHTEAIHRWICRILEWAKPRGNHGNTVNKSAARQSSNVDAIQEAVRRRSAREVGNDSGGDGDGIEPDSDTGRSGTEAGEVGEIGGGSRNAKAVNGVGTVAAQGEILAPHKRPAQANGD